jgi:hypothetical protein
MRAEQYYEKCWVALHIIAFIILIVATLLCKKVMAFSFPLDIHIPIAEEIAREVDPNYGNPDQGPV